MVTVMLVALLKTFAYVWQGCPICAHVWYLPVASMGQFTQSALHVYWSAHASYHACTYALHSGIAAA